MRDLVDKGVVLLLMLWSQIIYGHRTASVLPKEIVRKSQYLDIVRCPVKWTYYFKVHSARTAFCWVIDGLMQSAEHRTVPCRRFYTLNGHRTEIGIVRFLRRLSGHRTSARSFQKSSNKSVGTGRCFMSRTATGREATSVFRRTFSICIHIFLISLLETMDIHLNTKILISNEMLRMNNMQRTSAIAIAAVLSECSCHVHYCQSLA